jgi:hypothetical protein
MVHALREACRVLVPGGTLIDMRPRPTAVPVAAVRRRDAVRVGTIASNPAFTGDNDASDDAIRQLVTEGLLSLRRQQNFEFAHWWDNVDEMQRVVSSTWRRSQIAPSAAEVAAMQHHFAKRGAGTRLRGRVRVMIATYHRQA